MIISVLAGLAAGASFALAGVLQQRVAATRPEDESLSLSLLKDLAKQKLWVAGISFAFLSYAFQSVALAFGPLALVQPLIITELLFALPLSAYLYGSRLAARDWFGVLLVAGGLAVAILEAAPTGGNPQPPLYRWLLLLAAVGAIAGGALAVGRTRGPGAIRASLYALAGASIMGTQSSLLDNTIQHLQDGFVATVTAWQTYLLIIASIVGLLLIQSAFQSGPLSASLPVFDSVQPIVAVVIGVVVFKEQLSASTASLVIAAAGLVAVGVGVVLLDTSPAMQKLHDKQEAEAEEHDEGEQVQLKAG